jgi:hypothetical protein
LVHLVIRGLKMKEECIVLHESVSRAEMISIAYKRSWCFAKATTDEKDVVREVIYETMKTKSRIHYIIEKVKDLPYLIVRGEEIESAIGGIHTTLPTYSKSDIIDMIQSPKSCEEYIKGILYLGLQGKFKECDAEVVNTFKQILKSEYVQIRSDAIIAASYTGWAEFQDLVEPLAKNDPDVNVRKTATRFLEGSELP